MSRKILAAGALACIACCAPVVMPLLWPGLAAGGALGGSSIAGIDPDLILCGALALGAAMGLGLWLRHSQAKASTGARCDLEKCGPARSPKT